MTGVIILNYYTRDDTIRLYRSLETIPGIHCLVVDNSGDPEELSALKEAVPEVNLMHTDRNLGYAGGNNLGIRYFLKEQTVDSIVLINPDVEISENIFPALLGVLRESESVAATGPRLCIRNRPEVIYSDGGIFEHNSYLKPAHLNGGKHVYEVDESRSQKLKTAGSTTGGLITSEDSGTGKKGGAPQPDYINGSFLVMKADALRKIGLLDEKFFLYFEEADWCVRARNEGWELRVVNDVTAWQSISPKEEAYNYHFFHSWLLFLHRYDPEGVRPLFMDQLKKLPWLLRSNRRMGKGASLAGRRLTALVKGYFNR